jgi:hypothetical protein
MTGSSVTLYSAVTFDYGIVNNTPDYVWYIKFSLNGATFPEDEVDDRLVRLLVLGDHFRPRIRQKQPR